MANPKQPYELAKLKGATKKNPQRYKGEPPKSPHGVGEPPSAFSAGHKAIWKEFVRIALPGILTANDRPNMIVLCNMWADYCTGPDAYPTARIALMRSIMADFGMSPVDRQKFATAVAPKTPEAKRKKTDFSDFN